MTSASLSDKYQARSGRVYVTGSQALVRLPLEQKRLDENAGLKTAGFISGYRGSPLGIYDSALWQAENTLKDNDIYFEPGVNEDLAATAIWGSQQASMMSDAKYDGVFGLWYGKGPGVDRSSDVFKHANFAGVSPAGGVLALCGDDHAARSSTVAHQSDHVLIHCGMPILNPADIQDYIDLGLMGIALSRYASVWVGFKCVTDTVDGSASIHVGEGRIKPVLPADFEMPEGGLAIRPEVAALEQETRLFEHRLQAAKAFVRVNNLDHAVLGASAGRKRLGIVSTGKGLTDVLEALRLLGIREAEAEQLGLSVFKVAMVWPIEPERISSFAANCDQVLVVEEKRGLVEEQLSYLLYNLADGQRPKITGKRDLTGRPLISETGELNPEQLIEVIVSQLAPLVPESRLTDRLEEYKAHCHSQSTPKSIAKRPASFCAGCPHSTSTRVPDGSIAMAGIGCHGMASLMPERNTLPGTHMGGEGATWIGLSRFVERPHIFQNLGDGTYFHSALLAVRACVTANTNITYKILLNGAVGMTGGQPIEGERHEGEIAAPHVANQVSSIGVRRIAVVSDDPERHHRDEFPAGVTFHHRDELDRVQRELREWKGVSVLIYDQSCATERRRMRKRGIVPEAESRVMIASEVCEGCGDCGIQSGCIALEPLETERGRKRLINQSVCNQDYSCIKGFCPSFITVKGGKLRKQSGDLAALAVNNLPLPVLPSTAQGWSVLVTGIGGAGVVTIGAVLGMAAHIQDKPCTVLDMSGFAQRNGSVMSHIRFGGVDGRAQTMRIPSSAADAVIGCDPIVAAGEESLSMLKLGTGSVILNEYLAPTNAFAIDPNYSVDLDRLKDQLVERVGASRVFGIEATQIATTLLGNAIGANMMLVGNAWQRGLIPIDLDSIEAAIRLNGTAVDMNLSAFALGRLLAVDPDRVHALLSNKPVIVIPNEQGLEDLIANGRKHLSDYQDTELADHYEAVVRKVAEVEAGITDGSTKLASTVAKCYRRLLAYKDEYEVARLLTGETLKRELADTFEGDFSVELNLAPPIFSRRDPETGRLKKQTYGAWMLNVMRFMSRFKFLRGTAFDPFGYFEHRRLERSLIKEYEAIVNHIISRLNADNYDHALELAFAYSEIKGYDVVKEASVERARQRVSELKERFDDPSSVRVEVQEIIARSA